MRNTTFSDDSLYRIASKTAQEEYLAWDSLHYWKEELAAIEDRLLDTGGYWYDMAWDAWDQAHRLADEGKHEEASERLDAVERIVEEFTAIDTTPSGAPKGL